MLSVHCSLGGVFRLKKKVHFSFRTNVNWEMLSWRPCSLRARKSLLLRTERGFKKLGLSDSVVVCDGGGGKMLEPIMSTLEKQRVVLASSSPRRRDILKQAGLKFDVIPSNYEEDLNPNDFSNPGDFAIATAVNKVKEVEERLMQKGEKFDILIGVDTIVYMNGKVFGKPKNEDDAFKTLKLLSGNCHSVFSGVCIKTLSKNITFSESTKVYFGKLSDEVIRAYVKTGDPLDKAGGYGIQVKGGSFIEKIEGDFFNVVGFPLYRFCQRLSEVYKSNSVE